MGCQVRRGLIGAVAWGFVTGFVGACNGGPTVVGERDLVVRDGPRVQPLPPHPAPRRLPVAAAVAVPVVTAASPLAGAVVDARVLIITADGTAGELDAIRSTLQYLGTPFDVLDATHDPPLTAARLASGSHGKYQAIFLDLGGLEVSGGSAFTSDEWTTLATYEAQFQVRQVALYTSPSATYGLTNTGQVDPSKTPITMTCTALGVSVFTGTNCANPIVMSAGWAYPAVATDGSTAPLLTDAAGKIYAAIRTYPDGREALALTYAQATYLIPYLQLAYGLVSWATRGLFVGERHVYVVPQIDDLFLASTIFTGGTYRITDADMQALADWQAQAHTRPLAANLRLAWAANGSGSQSRPGDPLTAKAVAMGATFAWINHTWDHPILDDQTYADALQEFTKNDTYLRGLGLTPYASVNAVTPNISGLNSADAMRAIHDAGIRQIVGNTSVPGEDNPSPNLGRWNALQPTVLELPRVPTNIGFDTSQPAEIVAEYQVDVSKGVPVDYPTVIDQSSTPLLRQLLNGSNDSWMFHQANTRDYDGRGHSLLSDLLDATLAKYAAAATWPILSPTMEDLAARVAARMALEGAGLTATIQPGVSITMAVANAATVPVTGLCTPAAERYGGQTISWIALNAGQSVTLSLTGCNPGSTGMGGSPGTGGAIATAGTGGAAGASGLGGVPPAGAGNRGGTAGVDGTGG
ncbi:MAG TPA: hypothetical protein VHG72_04715, partial [Polyangia bacterium]|nr:hypothetical protein [Polyangia bacterium]